MDIPPRRALAGKYIVVPLVVVTLAVAVVFTAIRHSGKGAAEENFLLHSYMSGLRDLDDGYYKSAVAHFTPVIEDGGRPAAWGFRGEAYLHLKQYRKAEADFRQAIKHEPEKSVNHAGFAEALAGQNQFPAALESIEKSLVLFPNQPAMDPEDKTVPRTGDSLEELKVRRDEIAARIEKDE